MNRIARFLKKSGAALALVSVMTLLLASCGRGGQPDAPAIGTATAGNAQASVIFTPPINDGGAAITSYTVTSNPGNITAAGVASPITVTGLTNGTSYTFTVTATNIGGTSAPSSPSNSVTPTLSLPGAPTVVTAVAGSAQAILSFTPPVDNGGYAITLYTVTSTPGSLTATGAASPITVSGLSGATAYTFTVTATNSKGTGSVSAASNSITTSEGAETAPKVITLPYAGMVGSDPASSFYRYTSGAVTTSLTVTGMTEDVDLEVFTDATFITLDPNWPCVPIANSRAAETCTATTPVPAFNPIFIRIGNFITTTNPSATSATFTLKTP
jgi:hypothetical protein